MEVIFYLRENLIYLLMLMLGGLAFTVYRHLKKAYSVNKCFEDEILVDYFHGRLKREEDLRRAVVSHLGVCDKCKEKMYDLQKEG